MRKLLKTLALAGSFIFSHQVFAATMCCDINTYPGDIEFGSGTSFCMGQANSFDHSTATGTFYLKDISKPYNNIIWNGQPNCSGTSCRVSMSFYMTYSASATILYTDGTWETTNAASMRYEGLH